LDNDDYRRGRLTNHKVFGEANAILAGDALLTFAFELMGDARHWKRFVPERVVQVIYEVAYAIGTFGMIGGQVVDLQMEGQDIDLPTPEYMHAHKTGALIRRRAVAISAVVPSTWSSHSARISISVSDHG
jgi:geranylgeranyl diphosphate synthase type II